MQRWWIARRKWKQQWYTRVNGSDLFICLIYLDRIELTKSSQFNWPLSAMISKSTILTSVSSLCEQLIVPLPLASFSLTNSYIDYAKPSLKHEHAMFVRGKLGFAVFIQQLKRRFVLFPLFVVSQFWPCLVKVNKFYSHILKLCRIWLLWQYKSFWRHGRNQLYV